MRTSAAKAEGARRTPVQERSVSDDKPSERPQSAKSSGKQVKRRKKRNPVLRVLRWFVVPVLLFWAIVAGMYVGYTVLGHQPKGEVFQLETWKHVYDLMFSNE
ncbi:DNA-directed RNA polymerase subunit beta (plasmid) [Paenibacillus cellulosilyticus]|nr:DNA-directed RNA polymerase subunit beta [Paenibacillus cellulosilyticus]